jgi:hypothetical protein
MMKMTKRLIWAIPLGIASALLLLIVGLSVWPMKQMVLEVEIQPAGNFQEALRLIEDLQSQTSSSPPTSKFRTIPLTPHNRMPARILSIPNSCACSMPQVPPRKFLEPSEIGGLFR